MKKFLFPVAMILLVATGCLVAPAPAVINQLPIAYIDSVSPTNSTCGDPVTFTGHGIDPDGTVVAYSWRSSPEGDLSTAPSFTTSTLSPGTHTIWFRVQDNNGTWSNEVPATVIIVPIWATKPLINSFNASPESISPGDSSTLSWDVTGCTSVTIDPAIGTVALSGTRVVSPTKTTTYTLTALNEKGTSTATTQVVVGEAPLTRVELYSIAAEDGQVRRDGYVGQEPDVGNLKSGTTIEAFLSFDISMIPKGATIQSATLDLTAAQQVDDPFNTLGVLKIYDYQYHTLSAKDFNIGPTPGSLYSLSKMPTSPIISSAFANAVQNQIDAGNTRFQIRFQFEIGGYRNIDAYINLGTGMSKLIVEFQ
jgi:hypothetical protein